MNAAQSAYVAGVKAADLLLAHGLPVVAISAAEMGSKYAISLLQPPGVVVELCWPVDAPVETVEADVRRALELTDG